MSAPSRAGVRPPTAALAGVALHVAGLWMLSTLDASGKLLVMAGVSVVTLAWVRYTVHALLMTALVLPRRGRALLRTASLARQAQRAAAMLATTLMFFTVLRRVPLAEATAMNFCAPLMVMAAAPWLLHEPHRAHRWAGVAAGFAGMLIVVRPGGALDATGVALGLATAACFAAFQITTRRVARDDAMTSNYYGGLFGAAALTAVLPFAPPLPALTAAQWLLLASTGVTGLVGHALQIAAYRRDRAARVGRPRHAAGAVRLPADRLGGRAGLAGVRAGARCGHRPGHVDHLRRRPGRRALRKAPFMTTQPDTLTAWATLQALARAAGPLDPRELLARDPERARTLALQTEHLAVDCSKQSIDAAHLQALGALADAVGLAARRDAMLRGEPVNSTEQRAALHVALRTVAAAGPHAAGKRDTADSALPAPPPAFADEARASFARMRELSEAVRDGRWLGATGRPITDVVHIGIGGSGLGPELLAGALAGYAHPRIRLHFVGNVDPHASHDALAGLDAASTLVIVASKSWTTQETSRNAQAVRAWLAAGGIAGDAVRAHWVAVTARADLARADGLADEAILPFSEAIGGRYSVWSAVGLPVAISIGFARFAELLAGAHAMDEHFARAPWGANAPMLLGAIDVWNRLRGASTLAVVPYSARLARLPSYLQQLMMESNGKRVTVDGEPVDGDTAPVVWGEPGTDAQHSFFQLLHQGTTVHPVELIAVLPAAPFDPHGRDALLLAHCIAQSEALLRGRSRNEVMADLVHAGQDQASANRDAAHRVHPGGRGHTVIALDGLTPAALGALLALYEHRTFVQAALWRINPFDQFGVELGKRIAAGVVRALEGDAEALAALDAGNRRLAERVRERLAAPAQAPAGASAP